MEGIEKKLSNKEFVSKTPQDVVEIQERRLEEAGLAKIKLEQALERLGG